METDPWEELEDMQNRPAQEAEPPDQQGFAGDYLVQSPMYNVGTLDLDENSKVRYLTLNNALTFGAGSTASINSNYKYTWGPVTDYYYSITDGQSNTLYTVPDEIPTSTAYQYSYFTVPAETYLDVQAVVSYPADTTAKLSANGTLRCYLGWMRRAPTQASYPEQVQFLVNGTPIGPKYNVGDSGSFAIEAWEIEPDVDITKLGYRFYWNDEQSLKNGRGDGWAVTARLVLNYLDSVDFVVTEQLPEPEYNGLLNTIIGWLRSLWDAITELPTNIANLVVNGIKGLFVPSEEDFADIKDRYETLLSERLGFIYEAFELLENTFTTVMERLSAEGEYTFTFPGVSIPFNGTTYEIILETEVSLDNGAMEVIRPVLGTIVSFIAVIGVVNVFADMVPALISGTSYFDFIRGKKEGDGE